MISVYIIAFNEERKIASAIKSVAWADEIIVADSFSSDHTAEIATQLGAKVIQIPFLGFGNLRNRAIAACNHEWIFSLDADECCTKEVAIEISTIIDSPEALDIYYVPRKNFFLGKAIKHSWPYPDYRQPQLFRKNAMIYTSDQVHEGFTALSTKAIGHLKNFIRQEPFIDIEQMLNKMNRYSTLGVVKIQSNNIKASFSKALLHGIWSFLRFYLLKVGFLDGWPGFILALSNFEGTFYRYAKLKEKATMKTNSTTN